MDIEGLMLSEVVRPKKKKKTNTVWHHLHIESEKYNKLMNKIKKEADSQIE